MVVHSPGEWSIVVSVQLGAVSSMLRPSECVHILRRYKCDLHHMYVEF